EHHRALDCPCRDRRRPHPRHHQGAVERRHAPSPRRDASRRQAHPALDRARWRRRTTPSRRGAILSRSGGQDSGRTLIRPSHIRRHCEEALPTKQSRANTPHVACPWIASLRSQRRSLVQLNGPRDLENELPCLFTLGEKAVPGGLAKVLEVL